MYKNKPFKPLIIGQQTNTKSKEDTDKTTNSSVNKRTRSKENILDLLRTSQKCNAQETELKQLPVISTTSNVIKENEQLVTNNDNKEIYNVVFAKKSTKKHKTWEDDGILEVNGKTAILKDTSGNVIGRVWLKIKTFEEGSRLSVGNKELEVISKVSCHANNINEEVNLEPPLKKIKTSISHKPLQYRLTEKAPNWEYKPLVMPFINTAKSWATQIKDQKEVEVAVDPCLVKVLRPHQKQGVVFLYQCIMGLSVENCHGAILADEMGLGKTLQCVTLVWTLLNKGPYGKPILKRVLIVTPSSLCNNWDKEFIRWLGCHRISPYVVNSKNKLGDFGKRPRSTVLIISYEMFVRYHKEVGNFQFDLLICDEGHRLKNSDIKAAKLLNEINCKRRVLLSGTPIQNDLQEFYTLVDFVNPGILGTYSEYKSYYESHIDSSYNSGSSNSSLGKERAQELHDRIKKFILRRTQETINKYLPSKHEIVIFCQLSKAQKDLYSLITDSWFKKEILSEKNTPHLTMIMALKKICNHPSLFTSEKNDFPSTDIQTIEKIIRAAKINNTFEEYCGKISIVRILMRNLKKTNEKLVIVSYYTQTLDFLENVCCTEGLKFLRLDGSTPHNIRTRVIEQFNTKENENKVFLLSAKAGGVGLNLPGASRLVLFDSDWNPASDAQAMARIWRDGQKKDVYIYRLLTTGTIEEKIYQRQVAKTSLSEAVVDSNYLTSMKLSSNELKDLFSLSENTVSLTHDALKCSCNGLNLEQKLMEKEQPSDHREHQFVLQEKSVKQNLTINQLLDWQHYKQPIPENLMKEIMLFQVSKYITFIFKNSTLQKTEAE